MKIAGYRFFLLALLFTSHVVVAQVPLFKDGDRVCFIGNSITMNGKFHNYIELYYITRFPDRQVKFFNCGISGDVSGGILRRLDSDVLVNKPTWSVLMVGMNDVNRGLYAKGRETETGIQKARQEALDRYFKNVDSIVRLLIKAGSKVILQTPSIYDQTADISSSNAFGVNDALRKCAEFVMETGDKYNLLVVDYWTVMNTANARVQKSRPSATIIGSDRVHPGVEGHFLMAGEFLKTQQVPKFVSDISINTKKHRVTKDQAIVSSITYDAGISFEYQEQSLPYPLLSGDFNPDSLFLFTEALNKEILQIKSLKKGKYLLKIDAEEVGTYTAKEMSTGINLANNRLTPQNRQAEMVLKLLNQYWDLERKLRQIKYVEYQLMGRDARQYQTIDENTSKYFEKRLESFKDQPKEYVDFYKRNFDDYLINKPLEKEYQIKADDKFREIQESNKPVKHRCQVVRIG